MKSMLFKSTRPPFALFFLFFDLQNPLGFFSLFSSFQGSGVSSPMQEPLHCGILWIVLEGYRSLDFDGISGGWILPGFDEGWTSHRAPDQVPRKHGSSFLSFSDLH